MNIVYNKGVLLFLTKGVNVCQRLRAIYVTSISPELHRCCGPSTSERCWSIYVVTNQHRAPSLRVQPGFPSQPSLKHSPALRKLALFAPLGSLYRAREGGSPSCTSPILLPDTLLASMSVVAGFAAL